MKTAKLEILGIEIPLTKYQEYKDEGFVDLFKKVEELSKVYNYHSFLDSLLIQQIMDCKLPLGASLDFYTGRWPFRTIHVHICYEDLKSDLRNIGLRAHEETHALNHFRRLNVLESKIKQTVLRLKGRLKKLKPEERANIGGFYALLEHGFSMQEIKENTPEFVLRDLAYLDI